MRPGEPATVAMNVETHMPKDRSTGLMGASDAGKLGAEYWKPSVCKQVDC